MDGFTGNILKIELTSQTAHVEELEENIYRKYPGGSLLSAYYLYKELPPYTDPYDEKNILIFSAGIVAGTKCPGSDIICVSSKSPLTNGIGESESSGFFASALRQAGFDAILLYGKAKKPVYIYIDDEKIEIRCAEKIWGMSTAKASDMIKEETRDDVSIAVIGQAGENLVSYASIVNDYCFANARMGMGAVMGSKNVKAVVVRGTKEIKIANKEKIKEIYTHFETHYESNFVNKSTKETGMVNFIPDSVKGGLIGSKNFQQLSFDSSLQLVEDILEKYKTEKHIKCSKCPAVCQRVIKIPKDIGDSRYGAPTIEAVTDFGVNLNINDAGEIIKAYMYCQAFGLDITSTAVTLAFAVECFEKGYIDINDTEGIELRFGNAKMLIPMIEKIIKRQGIGDMLAKGSRKAAQKIGKETIKYAMQSKGKELPTHDPRRKKMLGLGYAVSPTGPDTFVSEHDNDYVEGCPKEFMEHIESLGLTNKFSLEDLSPQKIRMFVYLQQVFSFMDGIGLCIHAFAPCRYLTFTKMVEMLSAVTGWDISLFELMKLGEKRINLYKMFNIREGIMEKEDTLPERFFQPVQEGEYKGYFFDKNLFLQAKKTYYEIMNWNEKGIPRSGKLYELELDYTILGRRSYGNIIRYSESRKHTNSE